jgi:hypothetical protein
VEHDTDRERNFVEKARPHGWIDDERNAIKAHVE